MEKNVKEYLAFKNGETKMPEHLAIRKETTGVLFRNKFLEYLTRTTIFPPIVLHLSISTVLFWYGISKLDIPLSFGILAYLGGAIFWSFAEYNVHRFLYHTETNSKFLLNLQHKPFDNRAMGPAIIGFLWPDINWLAITAPLKL